MRTAVVGGHALACHGVVRHTLDVDVMVVSAERERFHRQLQDGGLVPAESTDIFQRYASSDTSLPPVDLLCVSAATMRQLLADATAFDKDGDLQNCFLPSRDALIAMKLHSLKNAKGRFLKDGTDIVAMIRTADLDISYVEPLCERFGTPKIMQELRFLYECD